MMEIECGGTLPTLLTSSFVQVSCSVYVVLRERVSGMDMDILFNYGCTFAVATPSVESACPKYRNHFPLN